MSPVEIKVAASPTVPRYLPLKWWQRPAALLGLKVKREMAVVYLASQNTYIVSPDSMPEFLARIDALGFRSAEPLRVIK